MNRWYAERISQHTVLTSAAAMVLGTSNPFDSKPRSGRRF